MAIRTTQSAVEGILVDHYDGVTSLTPFITAANSITNKVAANDSASLLDAADLELIERWLAAHFYAHSDQMPQSKNTGRASASFQGQTGMHLTSTYYGQTAMMLDATGYLTLIQQDALKGKAVASAVWLGTRMKNDNSELSSDQ